ncbi:magnesium transporter [Suttonella sp. R2A3]|uniref:magnesium transporter n=1 Tax=Suttonella sp. R2A3 TaxID=2908648 RepID=UPI001F33B906|nr:magnesium transporter [Suttonella sp. R2A3]UJF24519.1 magnesium transporter [Suttonella sp. R2A3]
MSHNSPKQILNHIHELLERHDLENKVSARQAEAKNMPVIEHLLERRHNQEIRRYVSQLHYADIADLLESLPLDERRLIWHMVSGEIDGRVLLEISPAARDSLIAELDEAEVVQIATQLDSDELADITPLLDDDTVDEIIEALDEQAREEYDKARHYPENQIGALMDFNLLKVREDVSCKVVFRYLRRFKELPDQADKIFIVDDYNTLLGALSIRRLLTSKPKAMVRDLYNRETVTFHAHDNVEEVANAFERYDLITAAVVDEHHRLIGRITIDEMVDVLRSAGDADMLGMAGVSVMEDLFSPVVDAFKSRWLWLVINLCTAFFASRVIGVFEGSIEKIVALASLMPIVAGIGGNAGNQTITMIVRAMAQTVFSWAQIRELLMKEISVALINGVIWGSLLAVITYFLYDNPMLSFVMLLAMTLNLSLAAIMGVMIPSIMQKTGRDPALGSSVLITACTDSGGFFIFLGLASLMLL